jgi:dinuclear metal center YbgI/SA1388 family protein
MTAEELFTLLETELPRHLAMAGDKLGVQVEPPHHSVKSILTCYEVTDDVLEEAVQRGCNCVVTYHPLIFSPLESLRPSDRVARCVMRAVLQGIAIVSIHTALDAHPEGTNTTLARTLGIMPEHPLVQPSNGSTGYGLGIVGRIVPPLPIQELARRVADVLGTTVRYSLGKHESIDRVAIVAGSGTSLLDAAIESGADAFITSDIKYHTFHRASGHIALLEAGHFEMERHVPQLLAQITQQVLNRFCIELPIHVSTTRTTPVHIESPHTVDIERSTIS